MKRYLQTGLLAVLIASAAGVFWFGVNGPERSAQAVTTQQVKTEATAVAFNSNLPTTPAATNGAGQSVAGDPAPVAKAVVLTAEEHQFILAEFVKAADKDMAKVQKSIVEARNAGAPADQIAAQENKLRMMQQFKQDTLARNAS